MSYEPTTWKDGDLVTSAKLNKIEQGIANSSGGSSGGSAVILSLDFSNGTPTLNKTAGEILEILDSEKLVFFKGVFPNSDLMTLGFLAECYRNGSDIFFGFITTSGAAVTVATFKASTDNGYPVVDT